MVTEPPKATNRRSIVNPSPKKVVLYTQDGLQQVLKVLCQRDVLNKLQKYQHDGKIWGLSPINGKFVYRENTNRQWCTGFWRIPDQVDESDPVKLAQKTADFVQMTKRLARSLLYLWNEEWK